MKNKTNHGKKSGLSVSFIILPILGNIKVLGSSLFPVPLASYNVLPYLFLVYFSLTYGWFIFQRFPSPHLVRSMLDLMTQNLNLTILKRNLLISHDARNNLHLYFLYPL